MEATKHERDMTERMNRGSRGGAKFRVPDPSQDEIREYCDRLQRSWDDDERIRRREYQVR